MLMNDLLAILPLLVVIGSALICDPGRSGHTGSEKVDHCVADTP